VDLKVYRLTQIPITANNGLSHDVAQILLDIFYLMYIVINSKTSINSSEHPKKEDRLLKKDIIL